jgi:hypothetical protein
MAAIAAMLAPIAVVAAQPIRRATGHGRSRSRLRMPTSLIRSRPWRQIQPALEGPRAGG